jgi:hypothetical protein
MQHQVQKTISDWTYSLPTMENDFVILCNYVVFRISINQDDLSTGMEYEVSYISATDECVPPWVI